jgi:hypothetical protein
MARSSAATRCLAPILDLPPTVIQTVGVEPNASINEFDKAIAEFATAYVHQTEGDWRAFVEAIKANRISASTSGYSYHPPRAGSFYVCGAHKSHRLFL